MGGASAAGLRGLGASGSAAAGQGSSLRARAAAGAAHGRQRSAGHESEMLFDMEPEEGYEKPRSPAERGGAGGGSWGGRGAGRSEAAGLEADLGAVRDLLHLRTPVEQTLGEAAGAAMDVTPGSKGSPQEICDRLRALGFRATKIGRSRRTADVLRSPRHSFVVVDLPTGIPWWWTPTSKRTCRWPARALSTRPSCRPCPSASWGPPRACRSSSGSWAPACRRASSRARCLSHLGP